MKKMVLKVWYDNIKSSEKKIMDITFSAGQTEIKKISYSGKSYALRSSANWRFFAAAVKQPQRLLQ